MRDDGTNRRARLGGDVLGGLRPGDRLRQGRRPGPQGLIKLTSGLLHEPRLFNSKVELPLEHPLVYAAVIDEADEDFLLGHGGSDRPRRRPPRRDPAATPSSRPPTACAGSAACTDGTGASACERPELDWLEPFVPWDGMQYAPLPAALERLGDDAPASVHALTIDELIEDVWKPYIRTLTVGPPTLLHGDAHVGNTYLLPDGDVGFLDWQVARRGNFSLDLGYFLQGALTTEDRRHHERTLLETYRDALELPADELPSADEIWLRYRASVAHGLTLWLCTASAANCGSAPTSHWHWRNGIRRPTRTFRRRRPSPT